MLKKEDDFNKNKNTYLNIFLISEKQHKPPLMYTPDYDEVS